MAHGFPGIPLNPYAASLRGNVQSTHLTQSVTLGDYEMVNCECRNVTSPASEWSIFQQLSESEVLGMSLMLCIPAEGGQESISILFSGESFWILRIDLRNYFAE